MMCNDNNIMSEGRIVQNIHFTTCSTVYQLINIGAWESDCKNNNMSLYCNNTQLNIL